MSEGASAESTAASQARTGGYSSADPLVAGEAIDEMLSVNDPPRLHKKRRYPEPNFAIERSGAVGGKGSYPIRFKLKAAAFTRVLGADSQPVGNAGAANVKGVDRKRIIMWLRDEEKLKSKINANPKLSKAKQIRAGVTALTAHIEEALEDYINERRKQHHGCGSKEIMNKLLELKHDALGGQPATARPEEALAFIDKLKCWFQRFRKRRGFSIRRRTSVGQNLPTGHEGMAWATLMKLRKAHVERAGEIYARRNPPASGESPVKGGDLSPAQLESVATEVFEKLGNMDQMPIQHEMPVETTLEKRRAKDARISTGGESVTMLPGSATFGSRRAGSSVLKTEPSSSSSHAF